MTPASTSVTFAHRTCPLTYAKSFWKGLYYGLPALDCGDSAGGDVRLGSALRRDPKQRRRGVSENAGGDAAGKKLSRRVRRWHPPFGKAVGGGLQPEHSAQTISRLANRR